ncbi:MAG: response regulator transcription factor [Coriobacteriaceae bacterium]|nr:response regulator transcription factor [Coriobacteriaceae bacterium]
MSDVAPQQQVLVVEDDAAVRSLVTTALEMHGYKLDTAASGEAAILEAASHAPDLVMLDLGLPDIDGVEVIKKIRTWSAVPIIVISARTEDADKIGALDAGADDYLTKPFSVEELLARVRASLRRSRMASSEAADSSVFENGPLCIDFAAGCAYLDNEELHLTPIEYKLLVLLAQNVGKVLTHTFITHEIWGTSWDSDIASLRVFMRTLRKKIERDPSHPELIQTHVGVGYRMQRL